MGILDEVSISMSVLLLVTILLLLLLWNVGGSNISLSSIPGPKPYPIIGNISEMLQIEAVELFLSWSQKYGKILKYKVFLVGTQVMVSDAEALKHILVTNSANYKKPESLLIPVRMIFGRRCVICLPHDQHALRRKLLNPAFNASSIKDKAAAVRQCTLRLISTWSPNRVIQIEQDISRLTLDILGECILGYKFSCIENPESELVSALYRLASMTDISILRFLPFHDYLPTRWNRDLKLIKEFVKDMIKAKEQKMTKGGDNPDVLDLMLQGRNGSSDYPDSGLSNQDIMDDLLLFIVAGHETATNVLCWTMYELARNPDIQQSCREEVTESQQDITTSRLQMIECCIKEAMRLYPPVPLTCRQNIKADVLSGYNIPSGTTIALQLAAMMRHPDYFEDPATFNPKRFLNNYYRHSFLPFLAGPDMCIGHRFAILEMKIIVASILKDMKFELTPGAEFKGSQGLTYHMTPPLFLKVSLVQ